jgi:hypothetical protein
MTPAQIETIKLQKELFAESCKGYNNFMSSDSSFGIYKSVNEDDDNITLIITTVDGISDFDQPYFRTTNLLVQPNGNLVNLVDFYSEKEVLEYVAKLKKLV